MWPLKWAIITKANFKKANKILNFSNIFTVTVNNTTGLKQISNLPPPYFNLHHLAKRLSFWQPFHRQTRDVAYQSNQWTLFNEIDRKVSEKKRDLNEWWRGKKKMYKAKIACARRSAWIRKREDMQKQVCEFPIELPKHQSCFRKVEVI